MPIEKPSFITGLGRSAVLFVATSFFLVHAAGVYGVPLGRSFAYVVGAWFLLYLLFCTNPIAELRRIANHCELPWSEQFERAAQAFHVRNENHKWKSDLTDEQCAILEEVLEPYLVKYGYESSQELAAPKSQCASA
jgi:hypothetical protein